MIHCMGEIKLKTLLVGLVAGSLLSLPFAGPAHAASGCSVPGGVVTVHHWRTDQALTFPAQRLTQLRCGERGLWVQVRADSDGGFTGWTRTA